MVRQLRIVYEGATYHVISRGNVAGYVFPGGDEKDYFLDRLGKGAERYEIKVYAFCVMGNHLHLLIQTPKANLPQFMHYLLSSYSSYLAKQGWIGHVFAGRFKAICMNEEEYLLTVSKYIHLNPVEAGIVERPQDYKWSSYRHYCDREKAPGWLNINELLEYFGLDPMKSALRYREFIEVDMDRSFPYPEDKIVAQTMLGDEKFVEEAIRKHKNGLDSEEISGRSILLKRVDLVYLYELTTNSFGVESLKIEKQATSRAVKCARKTFIYLAKEYTCSSNREIASMLGNITPKMVSQYSGQLARIADSDEQDAGGLSKEAREIIQRVEKALQKRRPDTPNGGLTPKAGG